ncbi:hypothetical protein VTO73DRAFT_12563 [Trametes versicolor]
MGVYASHLPPAAAATTYPAAPLSVLNATLGGRVHAAVPFARPCFSLASPGVLGHPDTAACAHVIETYGDRHAITSQFGAYLNVRTLSASLIDVRSAADVSAAFDFSRRTGVPLSVKNTGHDFLSRSAGADSLSLWMSFSPSFVPSGCKKAGVAAVTFGTGVLTRMLNEFADAHNVTIPGGADDSIAYGGGYVMGGGHSAFANAFGLAVDRVLQFEAVTPDGVHRVANACTEPDLFFALRGGGGSTFAVVLRVTMLGLPQLDSPVVVTAFKQKPSVEMQAKYIEFLVNNAFQLSSKGWGGYIAPNLGLTFVNPFMSMDEAAEAMGDLRQLVESELNSTFLLQRETSYLSFYNQFVVPTTLPDDTPSALASRLIPASVFNSTSSRAALSDALVAGAQRHTVTLLFAVAPYFFKGHDGLTSVTPAWREAIWHVIYIDYWAYNTTVSERTQIYQGLEDSMGVLRQIAPNSGVYRNEASVFEPDYAEAFWGPNYERLLAIKRKYDPDHLLDCWKCDEFAPTVAASLCNPSARSKHYHHTGAAAAAAAALQQLLELHDDAQVVAYCAVGAYSWFMLDFIMVLPTEIRFVWATKWNLSKLLFAWVRIFGLVLLTVNLAVTMTGGHSAKLRIYAMYNKNKWLAMVNGFFFFAEITVMLVVYNYGISVGTTLATPEGLTGCYGITTSYLFSIWIPGLVFEMWLVLLAIYKAIERSRSGVVVDGQRLDLLALLIRDNVIYFVVIALGLLTNTIMWLAAPDGLAASAVSMSHASMIVSGTRLLLNLFEAFHRRVRRSRGATTTGGAYDSRATEDVSTLPTFRAAKRDLSSRRADWADTTVLTGVDLSGATDSTGTADALDLEVEGGPAGREVYRLEHLYGPRDVVSFKGPGGRGQD